MGGFAVEARAISVVICAYTEDRWDQICAAVESVRAQSLPCVEIILVIDYNSSLFRRATDAMPDVRVVENEQEKGLSGGRNTGAAHAKGDFIAFLDDDAVAHEDWLKSFADSFDNPQITGVGGLTIPNWETARPRWMPEEFYWTIGSNYRGLPPSGSPVRNLFGGNMAFRREVFDLVDGFRSDIGRTTSGRPLGCEETEFCIRLRQRAPETVLVFNHHAVISHFVSRTRCTFSYFLSRCFAEGISKAAVTASVGSGDGLSTERTYITRALPLGVIRGVSDVFRGDPAGAGRAGAIVAGLGMTSFGYLRGKLGGVKQARPRAAVPQAA
jgi:glucosyl-dolichyl phosphate glucuronosyltransferase